MVLNRATHRKRSLGCTDKKTVVQVKSETQNIKKQAYLMVMRKGFFTMSSWLGKRFLICQYFIGFLYCCMHCVCIFNEVVYALDFDSNKHLLTKTTKFRIKSFGYGIKYIDQEKLIWNATCNFHQNYLWALPLPLTVLLFN